MEKINIGSRKIKQSEHILAVKVRTESNGLGVLKTLLVLMLIATQAVFIIISNLFFSQIYQWYLGVSVICTFICCINVLSSDFHGQAKATWILFMLVCFNFGYVFYFMSHKSILFAKSRKRFNEIHSKNICLLTQNDLSKLKDDEMKINSQYLYNAGHFVADLNSKTKYFPSGAKLYDAMIEDIEKAKEFIFLEYFIISDGVLLDRIMNVLKSKAKEGVDVRIIYDDMGSHRTLKRKTKKIIRKSGIKLQSFNRLVPIFNIALNLRDHRKIVVIDGKVAYTGGANLADEYVNEKRMHGYWKDSGISIEGPSVDNFTIAYLEQWEFLTNDEIDYNNFLNRADKQSVNCVTVPFVSGPNYYNSISRDMYANIISNAKEKLYIMTPYFIPDETIFNLLINKAKSGVDVRIILPDIADKRFVYVVSRNNAEKLLDVGIKIYTMTSSFVHSKVIYTESLAVVGSINMDLRSFFQQFESAVLLNEKDTMQDILEDFNNTISHSKEITKDNKRRRFISYRILAGLFNLISPFM